MINNFIIYVRFLIQSWESFRNTYINICFFISFIEKKANIDIGVSKTSSTLNEKSDIGNEIVDHITNADLKSLRDLFVS